MFASIKNNLKRGKYIKMLAFIVAGTQSEATFAYVPEADAKILAESEPTFVSVNAAQKDASGNVAVRATEAGIAASQGATQTAAQAATEPKAEKPKFEVQKGIALPPIQRGGVKSDTYPFATMEVMESFFVPGTEKRPNPAKVLASTVSSATKRFKAEGKTFTVRAVTENDVKGARVWRTA